MSKMTAQNQDHVQLLSEALLRFPAFPVLGLWRCIFGESGK